MMASTPTGRAEIVDTDLSMLTNVELDVLAARTGVAYDLLAELRLVDQIVHCSKLHVQPDAEPDAARDPYECPYFRQLDRAKSPDHVEPVMGDLATANEAELQTLSTSSGVPMELLKGMRFIDRYSVRGSTLRGWFAQREDVGE